MKISYKLFSSYKEETLVEYKNFYFNRFPQALQWYYPSWEKKYNTILHADRQFNEYRSLNPSILLACGSHCNKDFYSSEEEYYFSASVYFLCLIPHAIAKIAGDSTRDLFYKASGWPMLSAGLGGLVSPEQWLKESKLEPSEYEVQFYNELLDIILPFHCSEITDFLSGGQSSADKKSYEALCASTADLIEQIIHEIELQVGITKNSF